MTAPKKGDHVKVEYDAIYAGPSSFAPHIVEFEIDGESETYVAGVPANATLTVIVPPVKVGDVATLEVLDVLPDESVVISGNGVAVQAWVGFVSGRRWRRAGSEIAHPSVEVALWSPTVIYIPPDET